MKVATTGFQDLLILEPKVFKDNRGYFFESFNDRSFAEISLHFKFVQDNQSLSTRGVVRGLHFQKAPNAQTKLVRVLSGEIQDVAVDLRRSQPTFGKYFSINLSSSNKLQLVIPKGFAHGFLVLSEMAEVLYKCDVHYHPESEGGISYDDQALSIDWKLPKSQIIISGKDSQNLSFVNQEFIF